MKSLRAHMSEKTRTKGMNTMDEKRQIHLEAAVFRRLVEHLRLRNDVQNIDLMNLAGFCRNCLSKWYRSAAEEQGEELSYDDARSLIYGMDYQQWKQRYQTEPSSEQLAAFKDNKPVA
jgi:hypothetical protein